MQSLLSLDPLKVIDHIFSESLECSDDYICQKIYDVYVIAYCEDAELKMTVIDWMSLLKSFSQAENDYLSQCNEKEQIILCTKKMKGLNFC